MLILLLLMFITADILYRLILIIGHVLYKMKINNLLESVNTKADLLYMNFRDLTNLMAEVYRRKGYRVRQTCKCGEEGNGLELNDLKYVEVLCCSLNYMVEVEAAMKLAKCMRSNSIYRGMLVTLGDFKQNTRLFCHKNVIECVNGDQLLAICKEVQKKKGILQTG